MQNATLKGLPDVYSSLQPTLKGLPDVYSSLQPTLKAKINLPKQSTRQSLEELRTGLRSKLDTKLGRGFLCYE